MRNLDRAAADELADDCVARNDVVIASLFPAKALDRFQQMTDAVVADARVEEAGVGLEIRRGGQVTAGTGEEGLENRAGRKGIRR